MGTDQDWQTWGATDPYFGVLSEVSYRTDGMTAAAKQEFFESGEQHIEKIVQSLRIAFGPAIPPRTALDFGSGVGRLVIPLARRTTHTVGVDISPAMIAEAKKNCAHAGITNVSFFESDDQLSAVTQMHDLVHSHIVLQHIAWPRGRKILHALSDRVAPGGFLAVQILSACTAPSLVRAAAIARYHFRPANWVRNALRSRPLFEPPMQLHVYDLSVVLDDLAQRGFDYVIANTPWESFTSSVILAHRPLR